MPESGRPQQRAAKSDYSIHFWSTVRKANWHSY